MTISKEQMDTLERFAEEHADALIAYGADLYRQGIIKGSITVMAGCIAGMAIETVTKIIIREHKEKAEKES